ncbi:hypothetical protein DQW77_15280 [Roseovarius sp. TE539]|uniref:hypothetical protein n=1 Tax=Roseovarius sp. TE539 TaxID=2249812 RepID=UPI000DDE56FB|nr:hypothetical protein [Roseovarius sp. TE539]RBI69841.1 hypothetical protein DQW77_15280 [Roseovarius sp. TE539]
MRFWGLPCIGAHTNLDTLTLRDWSEAGSAGFEAARDGVDGLRKALDEVSRVILHSGSHAAACQA